MEKMITTKDVQDEINKRFPNMNIKIIREFYYEDNEYTAKHILKSDDHSITIKTPFTHHIELEHWMRTVQKYIIQKEPFNDMYYPDVMTEEEKNNLLSMIIET